MGEAIADIIDKIKSGVKKDGEYNLLLIDQMTLVNHGIDIQTICIKESWFPEHGDANTSIKIQEIPDGYKYEENVELGMKPLIVLK